MADAPSAKTAKDQSSDMTIEVLSPASPRGSSKKLKLDADVFGTGFNGPLVHEVVVAELAARRRGTHATRNRALSRGGSAKPWRQKGTGRARQGSVRAPQFAGGGTVFGPTPRSYTVKVNRKARRAALRCALSVHADRGSVFGLDAAAFDAPSTKQAADLIADRRAGSVLIVLSGPDEAAAFKSFRNLAGVNVLAAADCGVADLIGAATVVFSSDALDSVTARARKLERPSVTAGEES
jgi:large subunit ribosomal protein L4